MQLSTIALTAILVLTGPQPEAPAQANDPGLIDHCVIVPIHEAQISAEEAANIAEICVVENQMVQKDQLLVRLDDRVPQMQKKVAQYKLDAAMAEAENKINEDFARASNDVAVEDYRGMLEANRSSRKTYPETELRKARLEVTKTELQMKQATQDLFIARKKAEVQQGELEAAQLEIERRRILSPLDGIVVTRYAKLGEWVKPGDKVIHVVGLDRLRVEATVDGKQLSHADLANKRVTVEVRLPHGRVEQFEGKITSINPSFKQKQQITVWAEINNRQENDHWLLGFHMDGRMIIHWQEPAVTQ